MNSLLGQALKSFLFSNIKFIRDMKVLIYDFRGVYEMCQYVQKLMYKEMKQYVSIWIKCDKY